MLTNDTDLKRRLGAWFDGEAPSAAPEALLDTVLQITQYERPMAAWRASLSIAVMRTPSVVLVGSPTLRVVRVVIAIVVLAALLAAGGVIGAAVLDRTGPRPPSETATGYRLNLEATRLATWEPDDAHRYIARVPGGARDDILGDLVVERVDYVWEWWPRQPVAVPPDLVDWLLGYPGLDVISVRSVTLGGRDATAIDASPAFPTPDRIHYPQLLPHLFLDGAYQYRFVLVDLGKSGWMAATCGAQREQYSGRAWADAMRACEELLATWEWVEP